MSIADNWELNLTEIEMPLRIKRFTVMHFFNLMKLSASPAGTRWAALLYGAGLRAPNLFT